MRKILPGLLLSGALLLGACGGPATTTSPTSSTGGTSATSTGSDLSATSSTGGTSATSTGSDLSATSSTGGTSATTTSGGTSATSTGSDMSATTTSGGTSATSAAGTDMSATAGANEAATAISEAAGALSAVANDVTVKQGEALILDASQSAGNISDYKWTIEKAPAGAESVVGQVIREGSSGNVSLQPADYAKYFPKAGTYTVRLTVTDNAGKTSNSDFNIDMP